MNHVINALGQPIGLALPDWRPPHFPSRSSIAGRFCRLEPLNPDCHGPDLFAAISLDGDGKTWTYLPYGPFENFARFYSWLNDFCRGDDPLFFAIIDQKSGKSIGMSAYLRITPQAGSIEVGHLIFSPLLQKTPAATESMFLMMQNAFNLGYRRYEWKCDALNAKSRAAALRLGFTFEGIFRQAVVYKSRTRDTAWFSVIDQEWPELKSNFDRWLDPTNFDAHAIQKISLSSLTSGV